MARINQYHPQTISHPGETLKEKLEELNMGAKEFAVRTGKPEKTITAILNGTSSITSDMAVKFENVLKIPARYWLRHQAGYDERESRYKLREIYIKEGKEWTKAMPYAAMVELGWLLAASKSVDKRERLLDFFGFGAHSAWTDYYRNRELKAQFNISLKHTEADYALSAWLRQGQIQASDMKAPLFDKKKLKENLKKMKTLMLQQEEKSFQKLQDLCLETGIQLIHTTVLPQISVTASTRWLNKTPLIQLALKPEQNKDFWFTFFHAMGHILLHGKKFISLENVEYADKNELKEQEANDFANTCIFGKKGNKRVVKKVIF
ncbi:MAG: HigA family addiction module antitoxin [Chitinophagales bacterium]